MKTGYSLVLTLGLSLTFLLLVVAIFGRFLEQTVYTQDSIDDIFELPIDNPTGIIGYDIQNPNLTGTTCFGVDWPELYHAGEDWFASTGTDVESVADGEVVYSAYANYPGNVVILKHTLSDESVVYSLYGHLKNDGTVEVGQVVTRGEVIGHLKYQDYEDENGNTIDNTHLHWEIRNFEGGGFREFQNLNPPKTLAPACYVLRVA